MLLNPKLVSRWSSSPPLSPSSSSKIFYKLLNFSPFFDDDHTTLQVSLLRFSPIFSTTKLHFARLETTPPRIIMWYLCVNTLECAQFVVVGALVSRERRPNLETGTFRVLGDFFLLSVLLFSVSSASDSLLLANSRQTRATTRVWVRNAIFVGFIGLGTFSSTL